MVLEAINSTIRYALNNTNTADGLCLMLEGFRQENGARLSDSTVFRLAVVMTDGKSNRNSTRRCGSTTFEVVERVHSNSHSIIVFAIGVTDDVDEKELKAIASEEKYITRLQNFNSTLFTQTRDEQITELCQNGKSL